MSNYGPTQKKNSGCLVFIIILIIGILGYTGYRYFTDVSLFNAANAAYQNGDLATAYKNYDQIDSSLHIFDPGNYRKRAKESVIACAVKENNNGQALFNEHKYTEAFQAFQTLQSRGLVYKIGEYEGIANERKLASYSAMVDSVSASYSKGDCSDVANAGQWVNDNQIYVDNGPDISATQNLMDNCKDFVQNVDNANRTDPNASAESISQFIADHPDDPLSEIAMEKLTALVIVHGFKNIASEKTCGILQQDTARSKDPEYLFNCGNAFAGVDNRTEAIYLLIQFIESYPDDPRNQEAVNILADLLITNAQAGGAGSLPAPDVAGKAKKGTSEYEVQNDTAYELRVVFSGPEKKIVTVPPCPICTDYMISPMSCPTEGPLKKITLIPGNYSLLVETVSAEGVTPYTGAFEMKDGTLYSSCFYVVTSFN